MAIDDYKVTNAEVQAAHVQAAPNTLTGTAQENKAVFDGYPELLKEKHNNLIDAIDDALSEKADSSDVEAALAEKADIDDVDTALAEKVDKIEGKGLSANDYTDADKALVGMVTNKVDKEAGKGLSTNDYTTAEKMKLSGIAAGAEVNVQSDWSQNNSSADDYIKNKPPVPSVDSTLSTSGAAADAKVTGDEIGDLKEDFNDITDIEYGKNRFNYLDSTDGCYLNSSGQYVSNASWATSDYCYVGDGNSIYSSVLNIDAGYRVESSPFYLCTYDANKTFIEQVGEMPSNPVSLGSGVVYIRFCYKIGETPIADTKRMIEIGTSLTAYEPYYKNLYIITDATLTKQKMAANAYAVGQALKSIPDVLSYTAETLTLIGERLLNASTGAITTSAGHTNWKVSDYIEVTANGKVMITTEHFWGQGMWAFYDENKVFISGQASNAGGTVTKVFNKIVDVPSDAKYLVIGCLVDVYFSGPYLFIGVSQPSLPSKIWSDYKWTCVGDSLTAYNSRTSMHYFDYVSARTGIQIYNMGYSGCGYAQGNDNFMTRISDVPTDSDVVTIFGSGNDGSSGLSLGTATDSGTTTLGGVINTTLDNLYTVMPVVQLGIITPTPWANNMPLDDGWMESYANLIVEICRLRSIPCLDLFHCSNLNPNDASVRAAAYSKDDGGGVHPDEVGHKIIASRIKGFLDTLLI